MKNVYIVFERAYDSDKNQVRRVFSTLESAKACVENANKEEEKLVERYKKEYPNRGYFPKEYSINAHALYP